MIKKLKTENFQRFVFRIWNYQQEQVPTAIDINLQENPAIVMEAISATQELIKSRGSLDQNLGVQSYIQIKNGKRNRVSYYNGNLPFIYS